MHTHTPGCRPKAGKGFSLAERAAMSMVRKRSNPKPGKGLAMGFQDAIRTCFSKYATFSGRAPRSEFWWFFLFLLLGNILFSIIDGVIFGTIEGQQITVLGAIFSLAVILPSIAVGVRRLHDKDMSGWWYLLVLIPILGALVLLFFFVQKGTDGPNRFGPDPLA